MANMIIKDAEIFI